MQGCLSCRPTRSGVYSINCRRTLKRSIRVIKEDNPFPSVSGRTCHHPCEGHCSRAMVNEPVGIMALKRFVMDYALAYGRENVEPVPRTRAEWIAVVGAGPAGLTAAHDLVKKGYFDAGSRIVAVHTGGLQGNCGFKKI